MFLSLQLFAVANILTAKRTQKLRLHSVPLFVKKLKWHEKNKRVKTVQRHFKRFLNILRWNPL